MSRTSGALQINQRSTVRSISFMLALQAWRCIFQPGSAPQACASRIQGALKIRLDMLRASHCPDRIRLGDWRRHRKQQEINMWQVQRNTRALQATLLAVPDWGVSPGWEEGRQSPARPLTTPTPAPAGTPRVQLTRAGDCPGSRPPRQPVHNHSFDFAGVCLVLPGSLLTRC